MTKLVFDAKRFFSELAKNNNKLWFDEHRAEYVNNILEPSKEFTMELGKGLKKLSPNIIVDPRVNKSLFRINRDIRFSKDKTPYKTHISIFFWEGTAPKLDCPGFYLQIESKEVYIGAGLYRFPKTFLSKYRKIASDKIENASLSKILSKIDKKGYAIGGEHYKRLPKSADPALTSPKLILHNGLYATKSFTINNKLPELKELCLSCYKELLPLHRWFVERA